MKKSVFDLWGKYKIEGGKKVQTKRACCLEKMLTVKKWQIYVLVCTPAIVTCDWNHHYSKLERKSKEIKIIITDIFLEENDILCTCSNCLFSNRGILGRISRLGRAIKIKTLFPKRSGWVDLFRRGSLKPQGPIRLEKKPRDQEFFE